MKSEVPVQLEHYLWKPICVLWNCLNNFLVIKCCKERFRRCMETFADSVVIVHHAIADAILWIIVLRSRSVRYFCFLVCL